MWAALTLPEIRVYMKKQGNKQTWQLMHYRESCGLGCTLHVRGLQGRTCQSPWIHSTDDNKFLQEGPVLQNSLCSCRTRRWVTRAPGLGEQLAPVGQGDGKQRMATWLPRHLGSMGRAQALCSVSRRWHMSR